MVKLLQTQAHSERVLHALMRYILFNPLLWLHAEEHAIIGHTKVCVCVCVVLFCCFALVCIYDEKEFEPKDPMIGQV